MHAEIHGHRGARGLRPENTLPGFAHALELGVDALELDVALTADRRPVLTHDLTVSAVTSVDVRPAFRDDPAFPYVGRPVGELTLAQLRTLECGVRVPRHPEDRFAPTQLPVPNTRMPTLGSVLGLLDAYGADGVRVHVELKSDPTRPDLSADPGEFTELVVAELDRHRRLDLAAILSFDWRILRIARSLAPATGRYALIERATMDDAWLDGLHLEDFGGDIPAAAAEAGGTTLSPDHVLVDSELALRAEKAGLPLAVWTVNEPGRAAELLDLGVAAIVTDYPDRMIALWAERGMRVPEPVTPARPMSA
ncbi:glycerophosphodiester phosphodiesterase family protein [Streptosporangium sp. NBC_01755]|uniref:glycerophosphodiester phosphodiesterase family protein n=1 Tax=unclassified Streptosporangium TaxID=2632669 RepID=UPI002DDC39A4|nr:MULTISPECIES: glycerophosphodiester phosphodiesterase family protein [unclassified Streptosporangium]WSA24986.1 glycerophosphodiester phosphodiesterase family protein [Streptosporangium sp. NBC_01810]WSD03682.1 glycerophosphodiester phosphodiesterase family protein [Streptosporangium sp. NBC_01755]